LGKTQARAKGIMEKEFRLSIRKDLQELKRKLYMLLKIEELPSEQYAHLSKAYWELENFSRKFGE
jgi:hypothetical protein